MNSDTDSDKMSDAWEIDNDFNPLNPNSPLIEEGAITYFYDAQNRLTGANYNNQATITYAYDKANNIIWHKTTK